MERLAPALLLCLVLAGCGSDDEKTLTVLAAASLSETFSELEAIFEGDHPGVDVKLVLDSSATLADRAIDRAPGDVLATADRGTMDAAVAGGGIDVGPTRFATNVVALAVPADNPAGIARFADLDSNGVEYVACVTTAPCGAAADALLRAAGITTPPVSEELDVRAVLSKVTTGEADAGLVYRTDVAAAGDQVQGLVVPGAAESPNTYWVAVTAAAGEQGLAQEWIDLLLGEGANVLAEAGFGAP